MKTYLCGGINGLSDADAKDWRAAASKALATDILDPMRRDYRGKESGNAEYIVLGDLQDIGSCDFVLVNASRPSWGTAMEIAYAMILHKYVVCFGAGDFPSPWLVFHSTLMCKTLEGAISAINVAVNALSSTPSPETSAPPHRKRREELHG